MMPYCMKISALLAFIFISLGGFTQVVLNADGPGNTYSLITSVLAPGYDPIEAPDCSHNAFGEHIDEIFDSELNANVFRFSIHVTPDDDRCINFDRQRNEIKTYDKSLDNLLGVESESVRYQWKFKLPLGFQSSSKFTHIHQLKSVGDTFSSKPIYTLTTRKGTPDKLELRHAEFGTQVTLDQTDLSPFLGAWVTVTETIEYTSPGAYSIEIKKVDDNSVLFSYSNNSIANWRSGATFIRPKWGIYRSLMYAQDLRDEEVLFAGFSIEEFVPLSSEKGQEMRLLKVFPNPASKTLGLADVPRQARWVQIFSVDGKKLVEKPIRFESEIKLDVSSLSNGTYILKVRGKGIDVSQLVLIGNE